MSETMPIMQENLSNVIPRVVTYTTKRGTEVSQLRFYAVNKVDGDAKWKQIKTADVYDHLGDNFSLEGDIEDETVSAGIVDAVDDIPPVDLAKSDDAESKDTKIFTIDTARSFNTKKKPVHLRPESLGRKVVKKLGAVAAAALVVVSASLISGNSNANESRKTTEIGTPLELINGHGNSVNPNPVSEQDTVAQDEAANRQAIVEAEKKVAEEATNVAEAVRVNAISEKKKEVGLKNGQYEIWTDANAVFPGEIIAGDHSMNHGSEAWENGNFSYNTIGSKEMSTAILGGMGIFTESDAKVAKDGHKEFGIPESVTEMIRAGDYSDIKLEYVIVEDPTWKGISYNNHGKLGIDDSRSVKGKDVAVFGTWSRDGGGAFFARVACGGSATQLAKGIEVPAPEVAIPAPAPTTPEVTTPAPNVPTPPVAPPTTTSPNTTIAPTTTSPNTTIAPTTTSPNTTIAPTTTSPNTTIAPTTTSPNTTIAPTTTSPNTTIAPTTTSPNTTRVEVPPVATTGPVSGGGSGGEAHPATTATTRRATTTVAPAPTAPPATEGPRPSTTSAPIEAPDAPPSIPASFLRNEAAPETKGREVLASAAIFAALSALITRRHLKKNGAKHIR